VKVLPRRSMWNVRIARRKVRAFESCRHASVIPFVDVGTAGGMHYLAWPYVEGETLEKLVQDQKKLSPALAAHLLLQVAEGLDVCHQQGLFHGLLKPSNLLVGPEQQVYILDFGIGTLLAETEGESLVDTMSTANSVTSGLDCASPESIMDPTNLTPAGDQYSLGCVLYYILTGSYPFPDGSAAEKMMAHQFKEPTPLAELNPEVPPELVAVVQRLMQKGPENRFPSAGEVVEALRPLAAKFQAEIRLPKPAQQREKVLSLRPGASSETGRTSPSAPTPRPATSLPTRNTLRTGPDKPAPVALPAAVPTSPPQPEAQREIPGAMRDVVEKRDWDEQLGPIGVTVGAIAACVLVWVLAVVLNML
ncbi:MAG TPA: protein kinase, partial [Gemmataceae bacterium]|nr:protein kinase [Gemmataceae bacterium]